MRAAFVHVTLGDSLIVDVGPSRHLVPLERVAARTEAWWSMRDREVAGGADFVKIEEFQQELQQARYEIREWDFEEILKPILAWWDYGYLIHKVLDTDIPGFNPRGALWHGVATGKLDPSVLERITVLPTWGGKGLIRLHAAIDDGCIPCATADRMRILVGALPSAFEEEVGIAVSSALDNGDSPADAFVETVEDLGHLLLEDRDVAALLEELKLVATSAGVELKSRCGARGFLGSLVRGIGGGTLIVIAHQDRRGVHFCDGVVSLDMVRAALLMCREENLWGSVLLAVCNAEQRGNLAHCAQAAGVPVVMTHGATAYRGDSLGWIVAMIQEMVELQPLSLPQLVDATLRSRLCSRA